ncbi:MAG: PadR family transcriptional regulator [Actinobacteria bacterium]|nr:PadR family transcriptional regulator [Actinomycetota bacterium]
MLEIAVLGLLKEQPLHGYELKKRLSDTLGFLWGVSYGSLYPALRRLEREGAIEVVVPAAESPGFAATGSLKGDLAAARRAGPLPAKPSRRARKAYRITDAGEARFAELLLADDRYPDEEKAFALKLAFCAELPPAARLALLERRRTVLIARLDQSRRTPGTRTDRYNLSLAEHRTRSTQRDLEWVEGLIAAEVAESPVSDTPVSEAPVSDTPGAAAPAAADPGSPKVQEGATR